MTAHPGIPLRVPGVPSTRTSVSQAHPGIPAIVVTDHRSALRYPTCTPVSHLRAAHPVRTRISRGSVRAPTSAQVWLAGPCPMVQSPKSHPGIPAGPPESLLFPSILRREAGGRGQMGLPREPPNGPGCSWRRRGRASEVGSGCTEPSELGSDPGRAGPTSSRVGSPRPNARTHSSRGGQPWVRGRRLDGLVPSTGGPPGTENRIAAGRHSRSGGGMAARSPSQR